MAVDAHNPKSKYYYPIIIKFNGNLNAVLDCWRRILFLIENYTRIEVIIALEKGKAGVA